jgi:hypothetical protein
MPKKEVEYLIRIGPSDRYRHLHVKESGKILYFRVQYETKFKDIWYPVVRYDTAHGFAHRDLIDINGAVKKTPLFNLDYNDALIFAESDLKNNWKQYKNRFWEEVNE